jgi:hypothetical protein
LLANPTYNLINSSRDLASIVDEDDVILGINWAPALCMETDNLCYLASGKANEGNDVFKNYNISYFISDDYTNPDYHVAFVNNPQFEKSLTYIKNYSLGRFTMTLYLFNQTTFYQKP